VNGSVSLTLNPSSRTDLLNWQFRMYKLLFLKQTILKAISDIEKDCKLVLVRTNILFFTYCVMYDIFTVPYLLVMCPRTSICHIDCN